MSENEGRKPDTRLHTIAGRWQTSGHVITSLRLTIAEDGQSMTALWERSDDGTNWCADGYLVQAE